MNKEELTEIMNQVKTIAVMAGEKIMTIYDNEDNFQIESKDDNSPLTIADKEANKIICEGLKKINPDIPIISEENREIPYSERKSFTYCWMVDPLDGTKEFIKRNGEFTVNIALIKEGRSIMGVVYTPVTKDLYYALSDCGAFISKNDNDKILKTSFFHSEEKALSIVCSRSHLNEETQKFIDQLSSPIKVSKGSSLKFLIIAEGQAQLYPRLAPTMEWDTAAAQIILEEAGGTVLQADNGNPVRYNKENLLNPHFVASAKQIN